MYKIQRPSSEDGGTVLPVATIPVMLRNNFQFFSRSSVLRYFNYVGRHTQKGKVRPRVAIVVQSQLIIADLKGNAKRCIDITKVHHLVIEVANGETTKILIRIPAEYDLLLDVIRGGQQLIKAMVLTGKVLNKQIKIITGRIKDAKDVMLKCPPGMKKNRTFSLEPTAHSVSSSVQNSKAPSSSSDEFSQQDYSSSRSNRVTSPFSILSKKQDPTMSLGRSVKFSNENISLGDIRQHLTRGIISSNNLNCDVISQGSDGSDEPEQVSNVINNHKLNCAAIRRRSVAEHLLLDGLDASVVAAVVVCAVASDSSAVVFRSLSVHKQKCSIWCTGDDAEVFYLQYDGFMDWSPCVVTNSSSSQHLTVKFHITDSTPIQIFQAVHRSQLRRPTESHKCSHCCWCRSV